MGVTEDIGLSGNRGLGDPDPRSSGFPSPGFPDPRIAFLNLML